MSTPAREIILGVGGGIAAYKSCDLLRRLQDRGFAVTVVPTPSSLNFVGAATWEALSGRPVTTSVFESVDQVRHVSLAKVATAAIIAPATADLIARMAHGRADDLLTNIVLAAEFPILIVPAMHPAMWSNPATKANIEILRSRGFDVLEPDTGALTSGDVGKGRFPETSTIIERFTQSTIAPHDLAGKRVLVTAGGTREAIDPVRYIGNRSSGKQGIAIAEAALARGAEVTLILANSEVDVDSRIRVEKVESAVEMLTSLQSEYSNTDFLFMAGAVADAAPINPSTSKIKKVDYQSISLQENPDLLKSLKALKKNQVVVAFAAETASNSHEVAREKMVSKGADLIYLNDVSNGAIFGEDFTSGSIIDSDSIVEINPAISKISLAHALINKALDKFNKLGYANV
jgi:phosphopantothenoylcysteine decarboxylase/phosphopantothenate--cysteine ligase